MSQFLGAESSPINPIILIVILVVLVLVVFVLPIFNNRKQKKQYSSMISSVKVGDKVKTIGGILGTVVDIKQITESEKSITIETGSAGSATTMVLDINAIYQIINPVTNAPTADELKTSVKPADKKEETINVDPVFTDDADQVFEGKETADAIAEQPSADTAVTDTAVQADAPSVATQAKPMQYKAKSKTKK